MTTVRTIIEDALLEIGAKSHADALLAEEAQAGLRVLNRMMGVWNQDGINVYTVDRQTFTFTPNKQNYTIGTSGDFNVARPNVISMVSALVNGVEIPIEIFNDEQWRDTSVKSVTSTFPLAMWPTGNYPLNELWFWPIPTVANSLILYTWGQTLEFTNLSDVVSFPPGYEEALVNNLAMRLAPQYGIQPSTVTATIAGQALSKIKRANWEPTYRSADDVILGNGNAADVWRRSRGYVMD